MTPLQLAQAYAILGSNGVARPGSLVALDGQPDGDRALADLTAEFDGCTPAALEVDTAELEAALEATGPVLREAMADAADRTVATVGLEGVIVVDTPDALLVISADAAQDVKQVVNQLKAEKSDLL